MITKLLQQANQPIFYRVFSYIWLALTCYLLFRPGLGFEQAVFFAGEDKVAHFVIFLNLTFLWGLNFSQTFHLESGFVIRILLVTGLSFAALTEIIQHFIPHRGMDFADFIFDSIGILVGIVAFFFTEKRLNDIRIS